MTDMTDIGVIFEALLEKCKQEHVYSVIETSEAMGIPYAMVMEWASSNDEWNYVLEMCRCHCASHAHEDWAFFKLPDHLGIKYCVENDDEFAEANREYGSTSNLPCSIAYGCKTKIKIDGECIRFA